MTPLAAPATPAASDRKSTAGRTPKEGAGPSAVSGGATPKPAADAAAPKDAGPSQTLHNPIVNRPANVDPFVFWKDYFQKHDAPPADLLANLVVLRNEKQFRDIQAALTGYLTYRAKPPEIWMYEMLAIAIEKNGGRKEDVEASLGYAAKIARKRGSIIDLTRVADLLHIHHLDEQAAELLPVAMEKAPNDVRAYVMAVNLAPSLKDSRSLATTAARGIPQVMETHPSDPRPLAVAMGLAALVEDPELMANAAERVMSLGWPGLDEAFRIEARKNVDALAKTLDGEGRSADADRLRKRVAAAEYRDLFIRLTWSGDAGLDLAVEEPLGATATVLEPRTVFGGAVVKSGRGKHPESVYVCPRGFDGDYRVSIQTFYNDGKKPAREVTLEVIRHEGTPQEKAETHTIDLSKAEPIVVHLDGGTRKTVLPYEAPAVSMPKPGPDAPAGPPKAP